MIKWPIMDTFCCCRKFVGTFEVQMGSSEE